MRVALGLAGLLLLSACAQTPQAPTPSTRAESAGQPSAAKQRRVCREEGAVTGSRTTPKRRCTTVKAAEEKGVQTGASN